jgi:mono/diheme cytochrome c family protein
MKKSNWIPPFILAAALIIVVISCKTRFTTTNSDVKVERSAREVERGRVLVYSICAGCHYNRQANKFIGNRIEDVPGIAGEVYSANLTHSKTNGIPGKYTDAQLKYLLKTGVAYDGRFIGYMLRPNMAEGDLNSIVAFLRSDDPALAAADTTVGPTHYTAMGKMYMNMHAKPLLPYKTIASRPGENEPVALGRYLVDNLGCFHCHSKSLTSLNYLYPEQSAGYLAGGTKLKGANGREVTAPNITPDKNTGIGNYTREQFIKAVKDGEGPQMKLEPPMPKFKMLGDAEISAIYAYIKTIPPASHAVN